MIRRAPTLGHPLGKPLPHDPARRIAVRTHVEPEGWKPHKPSATRLWPSLLLLIHTVPTDEAGQPLRFAVWELLETTHWTTLDRGLILGARLDKTARARLQKRAASIGIPATHLVNQSQVGELIHRLCYQRRAALTVWDVGVSLGRLASGWGRSAKGRTRNGLSLVLSTLPGEPTDRQPQLQNGETENVFHPRTQILSLGADRAITGYTRPKNLDKRDHKGSRLIVSLQPVAESLTGVSVPTPEDAARLWETDTPDRGGPHTDLDVALHELNLLGELSRVLFEDHSALQWAPPGSATSPGTYARGLFERMGLTPPLVQDPHFPRPILAAAMGAYFAGDVFTQIRCRHLPICKLDLGSAYTVAYHLTGAWSLYAARNVSVSQRDPAQVAVYVEKLARRVRRWWAGQTRKPLSPEDWKRLARTIVWVIPAEDWLPHRPRDGERKGQAAQMVVGRLTTHRQLPYFLSDVLVSTLRTGAVPKIVRGARLIPRGIQDLQAVALPTSRVVDPTIEDPVFALGVERLRVQADTTLSFRARDRRRATLKGMAVAASSGLPAQVLDEEPTSKPTPSLVWDSLNPDNIEPETVMTNIVERPGAWYYPPTAAGTTASARLLLHLARGAFEAVGGTIAYWDTDSLFVVATVLGGEVVPLAGGTTTTEDGRPGVKAISAREVLDVRWKIEDALSPYPPELRPYAYDLAGDFPVRVDLPALLRSEPENQPPPQASGGPVEGPFYDGNRPKRHRLYHILRPGPHVEIHDGTPVVVEPTDEELRTQSQVVVTNPSLHGITYRQPDGAPDDWVEMLMAHHVREYLQLDPGEQPAWADEIAISLVAATRVEAIALHPDNIPYSRIAVATSLFGQQLVAAHPGEDWLEPETGTPATFTIDPRTDLNLAYQIPRSLDFEIRRNTTAPPANALTHDDQPVGPRTEGILKPAPTKVTAVDIIGRESRRWGDGRGILTPPDINIYTTRTDPEGVVALIRKHYWWPGAATLIAEKTGLSVRTIRAIFAGKRPSPRTAERLWQFAYQLKLFN